ncbi:MAG TPA: IclR family transcriptional regulator C-terminal domain-containing protein [Casimicrobiaceae bacterium]|nr:IclR family transcriptional regulator C-terminal domain-containing protein [Casimicrobiaceae bacterium]
MSAKRVSSSTVATDLASYRGDPDFMASLARGLAIIRAFSGGTGRRTIGTLARATGLSRAAVRRCLYTLHRLGYVGLDERGHYTLRPAILSLGYAFLSSSSLAATARPLLDQVSERVHESCSMAVLDGDAIVYLARSAASRRIMSIDLGVGSRLPAWCTSMGRVLLAALPQAEQDDYLARVAPIAYTAHTVIKRERLKSMLAEVARSGYAVVDEELELGLRSMAVPVRDLAGQVVAALNVSAHASRVSIAELKRKCLAPLSEAASELSHALPA